MHRLDHISGYYTYQPPTTDKPKESSHLDSLLLIDQQVVVDSSPRKVDSIINDLFLHIEKKEDVLAEGFIKKELISLNELEQAVTKLEQSTFVRQKLHRGIKKGRQIIKTTQALKQAFQNSCYFLEEELLKIAAVAQLKLRLAAKTNNDFIYYDKKSDPKHPLARSIVLASKTNQLFILHRNKHTFQRGDEKITTIQSGCKVINSATVISLKTFLTDSYVELELTEPLQEKVARLDKIMRSFCIPYHQQKPKTTVDENYKELLRECESLKPDGMDLAHFLTSKYIIQRTLKWYSNEAAQLAKQINQE